MTKSREPQDQLSEAEAIRRGQMLEFLTQQRARRPSTKHRKKLIKRSSQKSRKTKSV